MEEFFNSSGLLHRVGGPAVVHPNGAEMWYRDGVLHREDGPAVVTKFVRMWFIDGYQHRVDGPATVRTYNDGKCELEYWIGGYKIAPEQHAAWREWYDENIDTADSCPFTWSLAMIGVETHA